MRSKGWVLSSALLIALSASAHPQTSQTGAGENKDAPRFVSRSRLVLVPVIVTDSKGAPVSGLDKNAFVVEEDGKKRNISVFEEVRPEIAGSNAAAVPAKRGYSNFAGTSERHFTILLLDLLNTPFLSQMESKNALLKALADSSAQGEAMAVLVLSRHGLRQARSLTADTVAVISAVKAVKGELSSYDMAPESLQVSFEAEKTLWALRQIGQSYSAIPGRKSLIWASTAFPWQTIIGLIGAKGNRKEPTDLNDEFEQAVRALVSANVAVYPVDPRGLRNAAYDRGFYGADGKYDTDKRIEDRLGPAAMAGFSASPEETDSLRAFADETGGRACVSTNGLRDCFLTAINDSRAYYLLGYYLGADDREPGWRKLKVKVTAEGANVRHRVGVYVDADAPDTPERRRKQVFDALASPVESTGIHINVQPVTGVPTATSASAGVRKLEFLVSVSAGSLIVDQQNGNAVDCSVIVSAFDKNGKQVTPGMSSPLVTTLTPQQMHKLQQVYLAVKAPLELPVGQYDVRFAVRDNLSGQIGTVNVPVEVK